MNSTHLSEVGVAKHLLFWDDLQRGVTLTFGVALLTLLRRRELGSARLESLRARRSQLIDLSRRGIISDDKYHQLTEVEEQVQTLASTSAARRASASGPVATM